MLLFTGRTPLITVLLPLFAIVRGAPTVIDPVLDTGNNRTYVYPRTNSTEATFVLPTIQRIVQNIRPLVRPNKNLFFSGPGSYEFKARLYAQKNGLNVLVDFTDPATSEMAADIGGTVLKEYWRRMSVAYSEVTSGEAFLLLPGEPEVLGTTWYKGTIWDTVEWPILQKSSAVTKIIRINPSMTPVEGLNIKPIWSGPPGA